MKKLSKISIPCIAMLLLFVVMISGSFSWLNRPGSADSTQYKYLAFSGTASIKADDLSASTYLCSLESGVLQKNTETAVAQNQEITIAAGKAQYLKTTVVNTTSTNQSITLTGLTLTGATSDINICNLYPLKTFSTYSSGMCITEHLTVPAENSLDVEWYIYNNGSSELTVTFTALPAVSYFG
ncbi:MAG: hypothetical protein ACI4GZ_06475 [Ruminococcus sp.]